MSFYAAGPGLLGLSNHKCGSTTVMDVVRDQLELTVEGVGTRIAFDERTRPWNPPWKHADLRVWNRYLELNGHLGARALTFTTTRNPWDRMVSLFTYGHWHARTYAEGDDPDFPTFVANVHAANGYSFTTFIRDHRIDRVLRLEHLHDDLSALLGETCGVQLEEPPDRLNRSERGHYRDYYDDRSIELVWQMFAWEIETFGYRF